MPENVKRAPAIVRKASAADVDSLAIIGPAAYAASYSYLWDNGAEFAGHLATFGNRAFEKFLERTDTQLWVAEIDGSIVGFLSMIIGSQNPITREINGAEIPRIYLLPQAQGSGLGKQLHEVAAAEARARELSHIWLDVMASADRAKAAYLKWGFSVLGPRMFSKSVKAGYGDMVVLIKYLL
ncbi:ribosomal protein S18 acetylase RimI-like enzyme [Neorhizobium sp. R1-B]|uniref:GNAT family N-acetyltransferase n=1 Tax=unclassified Neorhizobium TaxID=2629175 RepID=UPI000DD57DBE|nr:MULTISPECIES: GNAT family N-acetyltransferase [unclassified Neorhizobium]TCV66783.1 ribosomal protein S18 acetylase RimI-like enzyme [Neorhizobium sp. S3-V5DH]TDX78269.1 ribosomal protein S18 acetylase RimI-like enzyme [Neorhizobium sp. R1-B]